MSMKCTKYSSEARIEEILKQCRAKGQLGHKLPAERDNAKLIRIVCIKFGSR